MAAHQDRPGAASLGWILLRDPRQPADVPAWLGTGWWLLDDDGGLTPVDPAAHGLPATPDLPGWAR
jgi:hypothetical protein